MGQAAIALAAFGVAAAMSWSLLSLPAGNRVIDQMVFTWIPSGDLQVPFALRLDPLSATTGAGVQI